MSGKLGTSKDASGYSLSSDCPGFHPFGGQYPSRSRSSITARFATSVGLVTRASANDFSCSANLRRILAINWPFLCRSEFAASPLAAGKPFGSGVVFAIIPLFRLAATVQPPPDSMRNPLVAIMIPVVILWNISVDRWNPQRYIKTHEEERRQAGRSRTARWRRKRNRGHLGGKSDDDDDTKDRS